MTDADDGKREPLRAFLGNQIPGKAFPSGNAPPAFAKKIKEKRKPGFRHARISVAKTLRVVVAAVVAVWMACVKLA